ncbi:MAG: NDP-hexose 4-ketoreductase, partial [Planctomycetaceae bacterium]|nr:NDP-hexose 4-ketoreductase [Planctomycetaceae bacterium]
SMQERVKEQIEKVFRPEFLNRMNEVIVFRHLTEDDLGAVIELELGKLRKRLAEKGLQLVLTDEAKKLIIKRGSTLDYGARPLRRAIESNIEDPLSEEILKGEFEGKNCVTVEVREVGDKKQLVFEGAVVDEVKDQEPVGAIAGDDASDQ